MPTLDQIRTAIKTKIETVANVGQVHKYERLARTPAAFAALYHFGAPPRILGWYIRRVRTREVFEDTGRWSVFHYWRIGGFMGIEDADATEQLFDMKIEEIRAAFRTDDDLAGLTFSSIDPGNREAGIQVIDHKPVLFAGALCHHALLGLMTQHLES